LPYASVGELPATVHYHLPAHAQKIYRSAFNNAWEEYAERGPAQREQLAHRVAWAAVKRKYQKAGGRWVPREEL
jgi:cation transport regulator